MPSELDPREIGTALAEHKRQGVPFEQAWTDVVGTARGKAAWDGSMYAFMEKHFRAAYLNLPTGNGRFAAPDAEPGRKPKPRVPVESVPREQLCKSGDECGRARGHGRFGSFCRAHAEELAALDMSSEFNWSKVARVAA